MAQSVTWNGVTFSVPGAGDLNWYGPNGVDGLLVSLAQNALSSAGGTVALSNDFKFGNTNGLQAVYFKSNSANIAQSGVLRLANGDSVAFRNAGNSADLLLAVNGSNQLTFNGTVIDVGLTPTFTSLTLGNGSVSAPALNLGDSATGLYRPSSNVLGVTGNDQAIVNFSQQNGTTLPVRIQNGLIRIDSNSDSNAALVFQGTQISVGNLNSRSLDAGNTALINARSASNGDLFAAWAQSTGNTQDFFKLSTASTTVTATWNQGGNTIFSVDGSGNFIISRAGGGGVQLANLNAAGFVKTDASGNLSTRSPTNSFNDMSPMTTAGDLIYGGASGVGTRLGVGSPGQFLKVVSGNPAWSTFSPSAPTVQKFTSNGTTTAYLFTTTTANATVGATYTNNAQTFTVLGTISSGSQLFCTGTGAPASSGTLTKSAGTGDSSITFLGVSNLATYTTPSSPGPLYLKIRMLGGGGGGGGGDTASGGASGSSGTNSYFGLTNNVMVASAGTGGGTSTSPGAGGTAGLNSLTTEGFTITGGCGQNALLLNGNSAATSASVSVMGGPSFHSQFGNYATPTPQTNSGGGGGGGTTNNTSGHFGQGGGGGGFLEAILASPGASYYYAVGTGGAGGTHSGTGAGDGTAGAAGLVYIEEFYQ